MRLQSRRHVLVEFSYLALHSVIRCIHEHRLHLHSKPFWLQVESVTNHDVKAIEYVIKERIGHNSELAKVHSAACIPIRSSCMLTLSYLSSCSASFPLLPNLNKGSDSFLLNHCSDCQVVIAILYIPYAQSLLCPMFASTCYMPCSMYGHATWHGHKLKVIPESIHLISWQLGQRGCTQAAVHRKVRP